MKKIKIFLLVLSFIMAACSPATNVPIQNPQNNAANFKPGVEVVDGMQIARLSWGKLNYEPTVINLKAGMPVKLIADTERLQGCFRSFTIPELGIQKSFNEKDNILEFTPEKAGTYSFGCAMGMGQGTLVIE